MPNGVARDVVNTSTRRVGRCHRERLEQHRVDDGEERGVEADADRERGDRDEGEPSSPSQRSANRMSERKDFD